MISVLEAEIRVPLGGRHGAPKITIKGGSRRAEKSHQVLMMMKAAKLGWAGPGAGQEQGRNRARAELRIVKQSREEKGQELGRNWGEARNVQDRSLQGAR